MLKSAELRGDGAGATRVAYAQSGGDQVERLETLARDFLHAGTEGLKSRYQSD